MDSIFISQLVAVLKILFIFIAITTASSEKELAELLQGPSDENLEELNGPRPNDETSEELLHGSNEDYSANGGNGESSAEFQNGLNYDYGNFLKGSNYGSLKVLQKIKKNIVADKTDYVELDLLNNETFVAKLVENNIAEDREQEKSEVNEELAEDDKQGDIQKLVNPGIVNDRSNMGLQDGFSASSVSEENISNTMDLKLEEHRYKEELSRGNHAESYGSNAHFYQPDKYLDLSRRFVPQYSSEEAKYKHKFHQTSEKFVGGKSTLSNYTNNACLMYIISFNEGITLVKEDAKQTLEPKLASPDLVLAVAKESALLEAARPKNPSEYLLEKNALRSGNYWNTIWKEDVNPTALRTKPEKPLGVITAKINPGSNLYDLVTKLKQISPRLLYVINKKIKY